MNNIYFVKNTILVHFTLFSKFIYFVIEYNFLNIKNVGIYDGEDTKGITTYRKNIRKDQSNLLGATCDTDTQKQKNMKKSIDSSHHIENKVCRTHSIQFFLKLKEQFIWNNHSEN